MKQVAKAVLKICGCKPRRRRRAREIAHIEGVDLGDLN